MGLRAGRRFAWPVVLTEEPERRGLARGVRLLRLRPLAMRDRRAWTRLRTSEDYRLGPWEASLPEGSDQELRSFRGHVRHQTRLARAGDAMPLVIEADGKFAGQVAVEPISWGSMRSACLGYWIGARWEGRGLVTLSVAMVIDHLLGPQVGLHRVEVNVRPDNTRSLAVCRRLELREEGLRRGFMHIDDRWRDHVSFAVVAEDLQARGSLVTQLRRQ